MEIYTDGTGGPKKHTPERPPRSGWGVAVMVNGKPFYEACGCITPQVTTNAAELEAMIRALAWLHAGPPRVDPVTIWSDSRYVTDSVASILDLESRGFANGKGKPLPNADRLLSLFDFLYPLGEAGSTVIRWVAGHSGVVGNEMADALAARGAYKGEEYSAYTGETAKPNEN